MNSVEHCIHAQLSLTVMTILGVQCVGGSFLSLIIHHVNANVPQLVLRQFVDLDMDCLPSLWCPGASGHLAATLDGPPYDSIVSLQQGGPRSATRSKTT
jgi:hypothetical protein